MRRLLTWLAGAAGGLAAYRAVARRRVAPEPVTAEVDPALELRAKLAETRSEPEPKSEPEAVADDDPDGRRRDVHEQARAAIDEMREQT